MKKATATILLVSLFYNIFSQSYKEELKKVNDFLKTFDNGYYGYLEIKDGYLYDRFASGKYSKSEIKYLGKAYEEDPGKKVSINCIDGRECVFSTYTDSYHGSIGFSQTYSFNTSELITLLDNLIATYKKSAGNNKNDVALIDNKTSTSSNNSNYQSALKKLNDYLKTFDNGYYGYFEVINNEVFIRLKAGTYCSALISDLDKAYVVEDNKKIELRCLGGENCMTATYTKGKTTGLKMYQDKSFDTEEFIQLINDLISTLKNNKTNTPNSGNEAAVLKPSTNNSNNSTSNYSTKSTSNNSSTGNYQTALKKLNDYLATFDNGFYGYFEVKDGYIFDRFKAGKYNKFKMEDIEGAVIQEQYSRVIFKCKSGNCISTDWKENGKEEYTQFTKSGSYNYQELADLLNNFRDAYLGKKQTSTNNSTVSTNKNKDEKENVKQQPTQKNTNYTIAKNQPLNFKKGDRVVIEINSMDDHYQMGKKSEYDGATGTVINLEFDDFENTYIGTIKIDNDNKVVEFNDIWPQLIVSNNNTKEQEVKSNNTNTNYQTALKKLNDYVITFDNRYKGMEVKDGYLYSNYSNGNYSKAKLSDLGKASINTEYNYVRLDCKSGDCVYSTITGSNHSYFNFQNGTSNLTKITTLLNDFMASVNGNSLNSTQNNSSNTTTKIDREQKSKQRQQTSSKNNDDDFDEDWDALEKTAAKLNNSTKEVKESTGTLRAILYDKEIILTDIDNSDPNFDKAKKYIGKKGKTKTYIIPNDDNLTFYGDIYFDGILFKFKKIRIKEVTANENTSSTSSNKNYTEPLKKLNEYLKTFNAETYRDVEVKDSKVYFAFFVYGAKYNSSIDISELKNNTIITIGKSVGSSVVDEVKISCKGENKCFYSLYSNSSADHFRFFSHSVKDFTKMEQLLKDFIKAL